ncbi:MAG: hypothetical protein HC843_02040 [Sphingomonadales bacterium]|nr:hypothetical protein [Sphingomonadales bacterium]
MKKKFAIFGGASALVIGVAATVAIAAPNSGERAMKADADGNGMISKSETMAAADERFAKMDVDGNGQIDTADREAKVRQNFAEMDSNKDGTLTEAEFVAGHKAKMEERKERRSAMINRGEGEMRGEGRRGGKGKRGGRGHGGDDAGKWGMADTNGDKAISRQEYDAATLARFTKADADGDGNITREERRAHRKAMREERKAASDQG